MLIFNSTFENQSGIQLLDHLRCNNGTAKKPLPFDLENDYEILNQENIDLNVENSKLRRECSNLFIKIVIF
jgi:hypothetical protein